MITKIVLLLHLIVRKDCFYLSGCLKVRGPNSYSSMKELHSLIRVVKVIIVIDYVIKQTQTTLER